MVLLAILYGIKSRERVKRDYSTPPDVLNVMNDEKEDKSFLF